MSTCLSLQTPVAQTPAVTCVWRTLYGSCCQNLAANLLSLSDQNPDPNATGNALLLQLRWTSSLWTQKGFVLSTSCAPVLNRSTNFTADLTFGNFSWSSSISWASPFCHYDHFMFPSLPTGFLQPRARDYCLTALAANKLVSSLHFWVRLAAWRPCRIGGGVSGADSLYELWGQKSSFQWENYAASEEGENWN